MATYEDERRRREQLADKAADAAGEARSALAEIRDEPMSISEWTAISIAQSLLAIEARLEQVVDGLDEVCRSM